MSSSENTKLEDVDMLEDVNRESEVTLSKKELKRINDEKLTIKRKEKALKSMHYLLKVSEKFTDFYRKKIEEEPKQKNNMPLQGRNKFQPTIEDMREAAAAKKEEQEEKTEITNNFSLKYFVGTLRPYQIEGVNWLNVLYNNAINGILADEMGLGKTIQVIALLCNLYDMGVAGPFLIVAPLSTIPNWESEFKLFAPKIPLILYHGNLEQRQIQVKKMKRNYRIDNLVVKPVVLTTYNTPFLLPRILPSIQWKYLIVDEGQRLKNHETQLSKLLHDCSAENKLLLTGTPLQNNITELWSLLNFLMPHIFKDINTFASLLEVEDVQDQKKLLEQEEKNNIISTIHRVLKPFMLRRLKKDVLTDIVPKKELYVFCPLSDLQRNLYSFVIKKDIEQLLGKKEDQENNEDIINRPRQKRKCVKTGTYKEWNIDALLDDDDDVVDSIIPTTKPKEVKNFIIRLTMQNRMIMYQKIVDHPYLVHFPLDPKFEVPTLLIDEDLVKNSGKLMVLDAMLPRLKQDDHKILLFSTKVMTLDLIEEYMIMRGYKYSRLDGSYSLERRSQQIDEFNKDPNIFVFLITTRAGGLGLNLTAADTVIFYDRDWNPQADIQAQDRCHRIGQKKPVMVYTLVTKNTIDEIVINTGHKKRILEKLIIKEGKFHKLKNEEKKNLKEELEELQTLIQKESEDFEGRGISNEELDKLLDRSELYKELAIKKQP